MGTEPTVIVIAGPTASGKTDLAIALSQKLDAPIISADSRQVYRELDVGVARPSSEQLAAAPHHLIGYVGIEEPYSAGRWARDARAVLDASFAETRTCIIAGGSGLHVQSLLDGLPVMPEVPVEIRQHFHAVYVERGLLNLQAALRQRDPAYAEVVDLANPHRLMRALAAMEASGETFTALRARPRTPLPYRQRWVILEPPRHMLYDRIGARVEGMLARGLVEEARRLYDLRHLDALQTIGYRELWPVFDGEATLTEATERIKHSTRQYARRQTTWNQRLSGLRLTQPEIDTTVAYVTNGEARVERD